MFRNSLRVTVLAIIGLAGCVDDPTEPEPHERDVAAEAAAGTECSPAAADETDPAVARALAGATWEPIGEATVERVDGKRISRAYFHVTTGGGDLESKLPVKIECTSTCATGVGSGCEATETGCSTFSCHGGGTCTKKSTFTPATTLEP